MYKLHTFVFSLYRETVYKVLNHWLSVSRCAFHLNFQTRLVDCILVDITPKKNEIKLIVSMNTSVSITLIDVVLILNIKNSGSPWSNIFCNYGKVGK